MNIDTNKNDVVANLLRGYLGGLPVLGPPIAEIIGNLIPNQRIDRISSLLKALEAKIDPKEKAKVETRMLEEKSIDLMEDGFLQAARALSEERIDYIASLLKNGLTDEDLEEIAYKRLLSLLGELDDFEVLILMSHIGSITEQQEFRRKHHDVLMPPIVTFGSSQETVDRHAIYEAHRINLGRLGLLEIRSQQMNQSYQITSLGRLLLRSIDQFEEN